MSFAERYLQNNTYKNIEVSGAPSGLLKYIVIIPAYSEDEIMGTLSSIKENSPSHLSIEVIIHVNYPESAPTIIKKQNISIYHTLYSWAQKNSTSQLRFITILSEDLPNKHAGAGLARKIAMDVAVARFSLLNKPDGFILSLDADTLLPKNYFTSLDAFLNSGVKTNCVVFNFSHPTKGPHFSPKIYTAAALYEIHLRYYKYALKFAGFPFHEYTIGSCFGVTAYNYIKHGGMSKRKAGEDFYFLQKVFPNSSIKFFPEIILTPSPRPSWRVPFGTGPSIKEIASQFVPRFQTYHPELFKQLALLFSHVPDFYRSSPYDIEKLLNMLPDNFQEYLQGIDFKKHLLEINQNVASKSSFMKRFYNWFDAFQVIKFLNDASNHHIPPINVQEAVTDLFPQYFNKEQSILEILAQIRSLDQSC